MSEEMEGADSTAQLEAPQEIAEAEANVVEETPSDEGGSDNMSLSELTTQLLAKGEEQEEGEADTTEEAVVEEVPDLSNRPVLDAMNIVSKLGWQASTMEERSRTVPIGQVVRTEPPAHSELAPGSTLLIVVSAGLPLVPVPPVEGGCPLGRGEPRRTRSRARTGAVDGLEIVAVHRRLTPGHRPGSR